MQSTEAITEAKAKDMPLASAQQLQNIDADSVCVVEADKNLFQMRYGRDVHAAFMLPGNLKVTPSLMCDVKNRRQAYYWMDIRDLKEGSLFIQVKFANWGTLREGIRNVPISDWSVASQSIAASATDVVLMNVVEGNHSPFRGHTGWSKVRASWSLRRLTTRAASPAVARP